MITIYVAKGGKPLKGASVYYSKHGMFSGSGSGTTNDAGFVHFHADSGMADVTVSYQGKTQKRPCELGKGTVEFHFWWYLATTTPHFGVGFIFFILMQKPQ